MDKNLLYEYKKKIYGDLYKLFQQELKKISIEFKLDYQELEDLYLSEFKDFLKE